MSLGRKKEALSVMEAMNLLSNMAEIELLESVQLVSGGEQENIDWRDPQAAVFHEPLIKEAFRVVHRYLQNFVRNEKESLTDPVALKGIQAIVLIADEAVRKMDKYVALYPNKVCPISKMKEYVDLKKYYEQQVVRALPKGVEIPEDWETGFTETGGGTLLTLQQVRNDQNYELFFIKDEKGEFFFTPKLLRHIRLIGHFEELLRFAEGDDPLIKFEQFFDWEMYEGAKEMVQKLAPLLDPFYKRAMEEKGHPYISDVHKALMALRMATSPKNLSENRGFKSCLEYYGDFHLFLRQAMRTPTYEKLLDDEKPFSRTLRQLTHALCCSFFLRIEPKKEALLLLGHLMEEGSTLLHPEPRLEKRGELQLWDHFLAQDESLRTILAQYPNGPVMKTLNVFRETIELEGYDPLLHQNFPSQLFVFEGGPFHVTVIRCPSPTIQTTIQKAWVAPEFIGFLHYYQKEIKPDKHLLISLEDARGWNHQARCKALEELASDPAFGAVFAMARLPRDTDFYFQEGEYAQMGGAPVFIEQFLTQIAGGSTCGFLFPKWVEEKEVAHFSHHALEAIHRLFFEGKTSLTQGQRLDFIEIFYQLLTLKLIEWTECDSISFTCKDAVDKGAALNGLFFGFLCLLQKGKHLEQKEKELLHWAFYSPALLLRGRAVDQQRFERSIGALRAIHHVILQHPHKVIDELQKLYPQLPLRLDLQF